MARAFRTLAAAAAFLAAPAAALAAAVPGEAIEIGDVKTFAEQLAQAFITVAAIVVVIAVMWGGIQMTTAAGDTTRYNKGKQTVIYALIGAAVIFGVGLIIQTIANFAQNPTGVFQ